MSSTHYDTSDLPYILPNNTKDRIIHLSKILKINHHLLEPYDEDRLRMLVGLILYKHLDRFQKQDVLKMIYATPDKRAYSMLIPKTFDNKINIEWTPWALTNKELKQKQAGFKFVTNALGAGGASSYGYSKVKEVWGKTNPIGLYVFTVGFVAFMGQSNMDNEIKNRTTMQNSKFH